jgi:hypothetical protein
MARPETLIPGNCYFMVGFHDRDLLFPYISTLKYLRCAIDSENGRRWLFEEPNEPPEGSQETSDNESVVALLDEQLYQVVDFPGLIEELRAVGVDHPLKSQPESDHSLATALPSDLSERVKEFLEGSQYVALTITILFTDGGLSLGRRDEGGYEMGFSPHPRVAPEEEAKIRALFASIGVVPRADYLADKGRTRILEFAAPAELEALLNLCSRVLTEVYAMRPSDCLKYSFLTKADVRAV